METKVYKPGDRVGRTTIKEIGACSHLHPTTGEHYRRRYTWYLLQCDCGAPEYWVNRGQLLTHTECKKCQAKRRGRKAKPPPRDYSAIPNFATMRLTTH